MTQRKVDKQRLERADRESKLLIEAERWNRVAKTARLRQERLARAEAGAEPNLPIELKAG